MEPIDFRTELQRCAEFLDTAALNRTTTFKHLRTSVNVWSARAARLILDALEQGRMPGLPNLRPCLANETEATLVKVVWPTFLFSMFGGSDPHGFNIAKIRTPGDTPETSFGTVEKYTEADLNEHLRHRATMYADACRRAASTVLETQPIKPAEPKRKRRKAAPHGLTPIQQKTMEVVVECQGNISKAAKRLGGKHPSTVKQAWSTACGILGKDPITYGRGSESATFLRDSRGQDDVADIDDQLRDSDEDQRRKFRRR